MKFRACELRRLSVLRTHRNQETVRTPHSIEFQLLTLRGFGAVNVDGVQASWPGVSLMAIALRLQAGVVNSLGKPIFFLTPFSSSGTLLL